MIELDCHACENRPRMAGSMFCSVECRHRYALDPPQSLACAGSKGNCRAEHNSLKEARAEGWTEIVLDIEGPWWNYLGLCPECTRAEGGASRAGAR